MNDTAPDVARLVRELYARRTGVERMKMGANMFATARTLVMASMLPGLPEGEVRRLLCARFYGALADEVYGGEERGRLKAVLVNRPAHAVTAEK
ncbi:MAG TPA: hypothetical protein VGA00_09955 [Acidiferrobacterales bacterium]|jgi:hypothetical protein